MSVDYDTFTIDRESARRLAQVVDAYNLAATPKFGRHEHATAYALELMRELDERGLTLIHGTAEGKKMQHLQVKATATTNDIGWFSALASTYGIDRTRERVRPGAFTQTIEGWRASGKHLPVHYDHEGDGDPFIICQ